MVLLVWVTEIISWSVVPARVVKEVKVPMFCKFPALSNLKVEAVFRPPEVISMSPGKVKKAVPIPEDKVKGALRVNLWLAESQPKMALGVSEPLLKIRLMSRSAPALAESIVQVWLEVAPVITVPDKLLAVTVSM
ncbi:hypothetical protein ES707_05796 [subsurface metagenome]